MMFHKEPEHCKSGDYLITGAFDKEDRLRAIYLNGRNLLSKDQKCKFS